MYFKSAREWVILDLTSECLYASISCFVDFSTCRQAGCKLKQDYHITPTKLCADL